MSRMEPMPIEDCPDPELRNTLQHFVTTLGFVPNSLLTMQRVPAIAKAVVQLNRAVFDPAGRVDLGLKRMVAHMASYAAGCQYCRAHTTVSATRHGIADEKMAAIYEYGTNPLFDDRERAALDFARDQQVVEAFGQIEGESHGSERCDRTIGASYGDAFLAAVAVGAAQSGDIDAWNPIARTVTPDPVAAYDRQYPLWKALYTRTKDISRALAEGDAT